MRKFTLEEEEEFTGSLFQSPEEKIKWHHYITHFGFYVRYGLKCFFSHPLRKEKHDLDIIEKISTLLDVETNDSTIIKSRQLAGLHRLVENTHARKRLEKWSLRVIAIYLFIVLGIVLATYNTIPLFGLPWFSIEPNIMIAILTTTTANIIGLGLIVLRGHFLAKEDDRKDNKT